MSSTVLLLGDNVFHSLSPAMQNAAFEALGIDCQYVLREVHPADLATVIAEVRADQRILGANVTIPHKQSVIASLDALDPLATRIRAVNTISREGTRLKGWNTDVEGFRRALEEVSPSPLVWNTSLPRSRGSVRVGARGGGYRRVAIVGAGGAARAVAAALQPAVARLWVIARNIEQARRLCRDLEIDRGGPVDISELQETTRKADLIVNATPVDLPVALSLRSEQRIFDLRTRRSVEGRAMLLHQGAASFEIWTGRAAPIDVMRAALDREPVPA